MVAHRLGFTICHIFWNFILSNKHKNRLKECIEQTCVICQDEMAPCRVNRWFFAVDSIILECLDCSKVQISYFSIDMSCEITIDHKWIHFYYFIKDSVKLQINTIKQKSYYTSLYWCVTRSVLIFRLCMMWRIARLTILF